MNRARIFTKRKGQKRRNVTKRKIRVRFSKREVMIN